MEDSKVDAIRDWPTPRTVRDIRSFLGTGNFYRRFIENFSLIARLLHNLTKKDEKWNWTTECQNTFEKLKRIFTSHSVLIYPDLMQPYQLVTDAFLIAYSAVLLREGPDNDWHPVAYLSGSFSPPERNYDASPVHSYHQKGITMFLIVNCSPSSRHWNTGNTTLKARDTLSRYGWIIKTWNTSKQLAIYHDDKPVGACF